MRRSAKVIGLTLLSILGGALLAGSASAGGRETISSRTLMTAWGDKTVVDPGPAATALSLQTLFPGSLSTLPKGVLLLLSQTLPLQGENAGVGVLGPFAMWFSRQMQVRHAVFMSPLPILTSPSASVFAYGLLIGTAPADWDLVT